MRAGFAGRVGFRCEGDKGGARSALGPTTGLERPLSVVDGAENDARVEVGLAPYEAAGDIGARAGGDDRVEPVTPRRRDRDEDRIGRGRADDAPDLEAPAVHPHALQALATKPWVVVHEADDELAGALPQLA